MKMQFCPYCGAKLDEGAHFCKNCGEAIGNADCAPQGAKHNQRTEKNTSERKVVYEGTIHKCPNCGEVLNAFDAKCPTCGYEIRNRQAANSIQELTRKLELIDARKMDSISFDSLIEEPDLEDFPAEPESTMKKLIGWDFQEKKRREAVECARAQKEETLKRIQTEKKNLVRNAEKKFENQKQTEKANLIQNFPIPNTKEDILEFALLASSNVNAKNAAPDVVMKAWIGKLDQINQKAAISLDSGPDLDRIHEIYQQVTARWNQKMKWHYVKVTITTILKSAFVIAGIILFVIAIRADKHGNGSEIYELIGIILLVTSAATLTKRSASYCEIAIRAVSGGLSLLLASLLSNGSMLQLCGVVVLIISAISFFKKLAKKDD